MYGARQRSWRRRLSEDGWEAERLAFAALALGEVEAVLKVGLAFVEGAPPSPMIKLSVCEAAGEEWRAVGRQASALVRRKITEFSHTLLDHFGAIKQRRV